MIFVVVDNFLNFAQNCENTLEPPEGGGFNDKHNLCFRANIRIKLIE